MKKDAIIKLSFLFLGTIILTLGFYNNFWKTVGQSKFDDKDIYCQSQVIGRVIKAEKDGIFSRGGFTGWVRENTVMKDMTWEDMTYFQFDIYKNNIEIDTKNFIVYDGQIGGQGITFSFLNKISPFKNSVNLKLFWLITSLSLAVLFSVFCYWVNKSYGLIVALVTFTLILTSPWLTIFGRNLYWVFSSFYLPFIILLVLFYYESVKKKTVSLKKLFAYSLLLIVIKLYLSGFELVTTFLVMTSIPLFYYAILDKWKLSFFIKRLITVVVSAITAIAAYVIAFSYQLSLIKGSFQEGIKHMLYSFLKRTNGNSSDFPEAFKASLEANLIQVLGPYFNTRIIELGFIKINFLSFFLLIMVISFLIYYSNSLIPTIIINRAKYMTLMYTTWISFLAPMSWFVIFKAHSYIHLGYNDISWYMPFCLFGFILIGSMFYELILMKFQKLNEKE